MKNIAYLLSLIFVCHFSQFSLASDKSDRDAIKDCLKAWGNAPFKKSSPYKTIATGVKVLGIGKDAEDTEVTSKPSLIVVKPSVNVLTHTTYQLMNPNGWYCFKAKVTVLGKMEILAHCKAHLASASDGVAIAGSSNSDAKGVSVLGAIRVTRRGCKDSEEGDKKDAVKESDKKLESPNSKETKDEDDGEEED